MKNFYIVVIFILFFIGAWAVIEYRSNKEKMPPQVETLKQVKYSFSIQNKTNKLLKKKNLWAYAPVQKNSFQSCLNIEIDYPYKLYKSENENQVLCFTINELPPFATRVINIKANMQYLSLPQTMQLVNRQIYLAPEKYIESNHPDIVSLAKKLKRESIFETAKCIYDWVSLNIKYVGYIKNSRGALYALKYRKGDCTEFMSLFIALCRANNIPARGIGGYPCSGNCIFVPSTYHNWAEFYIDNSWQLADCQKKVFGQNTDKYVAMKIFSDDENNLMKNYDRFRFQGNKLKIKMNN